MKNYLEAMRIRKEKLGIDHVDTAASYNNIGVLFFE